MSEKSGEKYVNIVFENGLGRVEGPLMPLPNGEEIFIVGQVAICSHLPYEFRALIDRDSIIIQELLECKHLIAQDYHTRDKERV